MHQGGFPSLHDALGKDWNIGQLPGSRRSNSEIHCAGGPDGNGKSPSSVSLSAAARRRQKLKPKNAQ
jgi:hypothetical protein